MAQERAALGGRGADLGNYPLFYRLTVRAEDFSLIGTTFDLGREQNKTTLI